MKYRIVKFADGWYGLQEHILPWPYHFFPFTLFGWFTLYISPFRHRDTAYGTEVVNAEGLAMTKEICEAELKFLINNPEMFVVKKPTEKIIEVFKCKKNN